MVCPVSSKSRSAPATESTRVGVVMMLEKPNLSDARIIASLRAAYGIPAAEIEFLPLGNDSSAWAYRVMVADSSYFLKVRKGAINPPSVLIPRYLNSQGIQQVVAPLL